MGTAAAEGPRRGSGVHAAASAQAPLAFSFRWRKTLCLGFWQIVFLTATSRGFLRAPRPISIPLPLQGRLPGFALRAPGGAGARRAPSRWFTKCVSEIVGDCPKGVKGCSLYSPTKTTQPL